MKMNASEVTNMGSIISFYSFKGGTGRTMALANVAALLATTLNEQTQTVEASSPSTEVTPNKILTIDWDLDAPGLHDYFRGRLSPSHLEEENIVRAKPGVLELFGSVGALTPGRRGALSDEKSQELVNSINLDEYLIPTQVRNLFLMKAGALNDEYSTRVANFDWRKLYTRAPALFRQFAERLQREFRFVLIDSRTGITDVGGICTALLPDTLVAVFTTNRQSLSGVLRVARSAVDYRKQSSDLRSLTIFPLPSRVDVSEGELKERWRYGDESQNVQGYQPSFERLLTDLYGLSECNLEPYFDEVEVKYAPSYSYGETIAVLQDRGRSRSSIHTDYEVFADRVVNLGAPWELLSAARRDDTNDLVNVSPDDPKALNLASDIASKRNIVAVRSHIRALRTHFLDVWPRRIEEMARIRAQDQITEEELYDYGRRSASLFEVEIYGVEQFGLAMVEADYQEAIDECLRVVQDWLSLSDRIWSGTTSRSVTGAPGLMALRLVANWGAKAVENHNLDLLTRLLTRRFETTARDGGATAVTIGEKTSILYSEGMLGRADLTVKYIDDESWKDIGIRRLFASKQEYSNSLAVFFFALILRGNDKRPVERPLYPGFRIIGDGSRAVRGYLSSVSGFVDAIARTVDEDAATFRSQWSVRREKLLTSLGYRFDFFDDAGLPNQI